MNNAVSTVSHAIADVVAEESEIVFGLMGNGNAYLVSNLTERGMKFISARHEAGTVAMADGYYRASSRIATATVTYGPGFTNTLTSLTEARQARIPLVLIVGDAPTSGRRPWDIDQVMAAQALGVSTLTVGLDNAASLTRYAFALARRDRIPVILAIPYDAANQPLEPQTAVPELPRAIPAPPSTEQVSRAASALQNAQRPLILGGRGAALSGAGPALRETGDRLGALFATTVMARNLFDSPWDLGIAGGFSRPGPVSLMRQADVVLVVGASLNMFQMRYGTLLADATTIIQVDEAPAATHPQVTDFVQADAALFAEQLLAQLQPSVGSSWRTNTPEVADGRILREEQPDHLGPDGRLDPRPFAQALAGILPRERTIVQDGGHFSGWMPMYCPTPDPHALLLVGTAFQTIGLGFPAAVGAAQAQPERTTVLVTGDGGALMALADLETMIRTVRSGIVVVFNDAAYGAELHQYAVRGLDKTAMLIDEVDFSAVGRALGAEGIKARSVSDLAALMRWVDRGARGTFVLDIPVSQEVVAAYMQESVASLLTK